MTDSEPIRPPEPVTMAMGVKGRSVSVSLVCKADENRAGASEACPQEASHYRRGVLGKVAGFRTASVSPPYEDPAAARARAARRGARQARLLAGHGRHAPEPRS